MRFFGFSVGFLVGWFVLLDFCLGIFVLLLFLVLVLLGFFFLFLCFVLFVFFSCEKKISFCLTCHGKCLGFVLFDPLLPCSSSSSPDLQPPRVPQNSSLPAPGQHGRRSHSPWILLSQDPSPPQGPVLLHHPQMLSEDPSDVTSGDTKATRQVQSFRTDLFSSSWSVTKLI